MSQEMITKKPGYGERPQEWTVYSPAGVAMKGQPVSLAPRIDTLAGKKIGLLWNHKPGGDVFLSRLAELLEKKYQDVEIIKLWEIDAIGAKFRRKAEDEVVEQLAKSVDLIIASQAD